MGLYLHSPNALSWRGAHLKSTANFTFTFYIWDLTREQTIQKLLPFNDFGVRDGVFTAMYVQVEVFQTVTFRISCFFHRQCKVLCTGNFCRILTMVY
jgi:hypothetical protein